MKTKILWSWEVEEDLDGIAVVADVWAATTNISSLLRKGVKELILVNADNVAKAKQVYKDALVIGESKNLPKDFFTFSNLPIVIEEAFLTDKKVLFMSHNGSQVIELAFKKKAKKVLAVNFTNLSSIYDYLKHSNETIYLIASGNSGEKVSEDLLCIESLEHMLHGRPVDLQKAHEESRKFIDVYYGDEDFDRVSNFEVIFNVNGTKTIPICLPNEYGFIDVKSL